MIKTITQSFALIAAVTLTTQSVNAQKKIKFEKIYFFDQEHSYEGYNVRTNNAVSMEKEVKFSLKVENQSKNILVYDPSKSSIVVNGETLNVKEKQKIIELDDTDTWTINGFGDKLNEIESFDFKLSGIKEIVEAEQSLPMPELKLPLETNSISSGDIELSVKGSDKKTQYTKVKLEVTNRSKEYIVIHPSAASARLENGNVFACSNKKEKAVIVAPGEKETFSVAWDRLPGGPTNDMQLRDMFIQWEGVFYSATTNDLKDEFLHFEWDEKLSLEKR